MVGRLAGSRRGAHFRLVHGVESPQLNLSVRRLRRSYEERAAVVVRGRIHQRGRDLRVAQHLDSLPRRSKVRSWLRRLRAVFHGMAGIHFANRHRGSDRSRSGPADTSRTHWVPHHSRAVILGALQIAFSSEGMGLPTMYGSSLPAVTVAFLVAWRLSVRERSLTSEPPVA